MAVNISAISLLLFKAHFGMIYKNSFVDIMEMACYANLGIFSTIRLQFDDREIVNITAYISGAFTVTLLVIIISYYSLNAMLDLKCSKRYTNFFERRFHRNELENSNDTVLSSRTSKESYPTYSIVDIAELEDCGGQNSQISENDIIEPRLTSDMVDDIASDSESTGSTTPLLIQNKCD